MHPGVQWAVSDVEAGLFYGLTSLGVEVVRHSGSEFSAAAKGVDAVIVVSGIKITDEELAAARAVCPVYLVFTETPYDQERELRQAALVDGCWTHERASLPAFRVVNPRSAYLRHAWHPERHFVDPQEPTLDVVFVGSGFPERITFFNKIDWTGINLALYGIWDGFGLKESLEPCVKSGPIDNEQAARLYRRTRIGLNLYRRTDKPVASLNPRAYELAACGTFQVSEYRDESAEVFGEWAATFTTPAEAEARIRHYLALPDMRARVAERNRLAVASHSWAHRAEAVVRDLSAWSRLEAA